MDLATDEVAASMCAFQVLTWLDRSKENMLRKHVAVLGKAFKMTRDVSRDFAHAAKTLASLVQTCKTQQINVTNRVAWSWVLVPQWRSRFLSKFIELPKELETLIVFYLSIKMNTTTLERNLGELCRQLGAHGGHGAEDGSLAASLLEVALDGPQREEDLFDRIQADGESSHPQILAGPARNFGYFILGGGSDTSTQEEVPRRSRLPAQDRSKPSCCKGMLQQIGLPKWGEHMLLGLHLSRA